MNAFEADRKKKERESNQSCFSNDQTRPNLKLFRGARDEKREKLTWSEDRFPEWRRTQLKYFLQTDLTSTIDVDCYSRST